MSKNNFVLSPVGSIKVVVEIDIPVDAGQKPVKQDFIVKFKKIPVSEQKKITKRLFPQFTEKSSFISALAKMSDEDRTDLMCSLLPDIIDENAVKSIDFSHLLDDESERLTDEEVLLDHIIDIEGITDTDGKPVLYDKTLLEALLEMDYVSKQLIQSWTEVNLPQLAGVLQAKNS